MCINLFLQLQRNTGTLHKIYLTKYLGHFATSTLAKISKAIRTKVNKRGLMMLKNTQLVIKQTGLSQSEGHRFTDMFVALPLHLLVPFFGKVNQGCHRFNGMGSQRREGWQGVGWVATEETPLKNREREIKDKLARGVKFFSWMRTWQEWLRMEMGKSWKKGFL